MSQYSVRQMHRNRLIERITGCREEVLDKMKKVKQWQPYFINTVSTKCTAGLQVKQQNLKSKAGWCSSNEYK